MGVLTYVVKLAQKRVFFTYINTDFFLILTESISS